MITVNTYAVTERAVYEGVAQGLNEAMQNPEVAKQPQLIVSEIVRTVMNELMATFDFGIQTVRFTPQQVEKFMASQPQPEQEAK